MRPAPLPQAPTARTLQGEIVDAGQDGIALAQPVDDLGGTADVLGGFSMATKRRSAATSSTISGVALPGRRPSWNRSLPAGRLRPRRLVGSPPSRPGRCDRSGSAESICLCQNFSVRLRCSGVWPGANRPCLWHTPGTPPLKRSGWPDRPASSVDAKYEKSWRAGQNETANTYVIEVAR